MDARGEHQVSSGCKTDEKQISVVLMGEEEFRFSLLNRLLSFGGCQDPHCAPEIRICVLMVYISLYSSENKRT